MGKSSVLLIDLHWLISARQWWISARTIAADKSRARLGGGMLCGAVEIETAKAGVATVLGQCPSVGVGGFFSAGALVRS